MKNLIEDRKSSIPISELNEMARNNLKWLIDFSETKYNDEIHVIANDIVYDRKPFVLLAGPSSSGKTTTSHKISDELAKRGKQSIYMSLDDFFINRENTPKLPDGQYDFENFKILDLDTFYKCIDDLINKHETELPIFDFVTGRRKKETRHLTITKDHVIIIEGIHALNPELIGTNTDFFYKIYICVYTDFIINKQSKIPAKLLRFMRRMIRDIQTRGSSIEHTINMWNNVCAGEEKFIKPYRETAHHMFDTTHPYELLLYSQYLTPLLEKNQHLAYAKELYEKLQFCDKLKQDCIPENSLLWEFIVKGVDIEKLY